MMSDEEMLMLDVLVDGGHYRITQDSYGLVKKYRHGEVINKQATNLELMAGYEISKLKQLVSKLTAEISLHQNSADDAQNLFDAEIDRLTAELELSKRNKETVQEQFDAAIDRVQRLEAENKALKEAVRWRVWPDEKPDTDQGIVCDNECWVYLGDGQLQSQSGDLYEFNLSDTWLPIPGEGDET